jgi:flagellar M-ring protein FliF
VVGRDNVKAQVTAEIDFSQTESTSEQHKPNQSPDSAAVRSQQVVESGGGSAPPAHRRARRHQQPAGRGLHAPINGAAPTLNAGNGASGGSTPGRRVGHQLRGSTRPSRWSSGTGAVKRLSAAVVVNYQSGPEASP